jgi:hypothetical protein
MLLPGLVNIVNMVSWLTQPFLPVNLRESTSKPPGPSVTHLVLFTTTLFTIIEDIITGIIFWEQKGLFDLPLLSHQQEEHQQED